MDNFNNAAEFAKLQRNLENQMKSQQSAFQQQQQLLDQRANETFSQAPVNLFRQMAIGASTPAGQAYEPSASGSGVVDWYDFYIGHGYPPAIANEYALRQARGSGNND